MRLFIRAVCAGTPDLSSCDFFVMPVEISTKTRPEDYTVFVSRVFEHVITTGHDLFLVRSRPA